MLTIEPQTLICHQQFHDFHTKTEEYFMIYKHWASDWAIFVTSQHIVAGGNKET